MNDIKALGLELDCLIHRVIAHLDRQREDAFVEFPHGSDETERLDAADPFGWAELAAKDLQVGLMKLTRAVAQPTSF